jgi:hypothetical protein
VIAILVLVLHRPAGTIAADGDAIAAEGAGQRHFLRFRLRYRERCGAEEEQGERKSHFHAYIHGAADSDEWARPLDEAAVPDEIFRVNWSIAALQSTAFHTLAALFARFLEARRCVL